MLQWTIISTLRRTPLMLTLTMLRKRAVALCAQNVKFTWRHTKLLAIGTTQQTRDDGPKLSWRSKINQRRANVSCLLGIDVCELEVYLREYQLEHCKGRLQGCSRCSIKSEAYRRGVSGAEANNARTPHECPSHGTVSATKAYMYLMSSLYQLILTKGINLWCSDYKLRKGSESYIIVQKK